jgi:hypothetical protein
VGLLLWLRTARRRALAEAESYLAARTVLMRDGACSFGRESHGVTQIRGNGILALTDTELWFRMLLPARTTTVPVSAITAIETPRSHLGKGTIRPLLKVRFTTDHGEDAIAWSVANLDRWIAKLEQLTGISRTDGSASR